MGTVTSAGFWGPSNYEGVPPQLQVDNESFRLAHSSAEVSVGIRVSHCWMLQWIPGSCISHQEHMHGCNWRVRWLSQQMHVLLA